MSLDVNNIIIICHLNSSKWFYVRSADNPADSSSPGLDGNMKKRVKQWFDGPRFLSQPEKTWETSNDQCLLNLEDSEIKYSVNTISFQDDILSRIERYSSWERMKRVMSLVIKFKSNIIKARDLKQNNVTPSVEDNLIDVRYMEMAQKKIIKLVQCKVFVEEIESLKINKRILKGSPIYKLDPYLDEEGLLRVGGRLNKGQLNINITHPILLPKNGCITLAIIRWCHKNVAHGGRGYTLNEIRQNGFWIVNANSATRSTIYKCVVCRKLRGKVGEQKMASIPKERISDDSLFTYCALDMFR